jgi:hypothetical protein
VSNLTRQLIVKGQINLDKHPKTKEFWELYETIKESRQKTESRTKEEEKLSKRQREFLAIEYSKLKTKLNELANIISGILILDALEDNTELEVRDMQWEYCSKDSKNTESNFEYMFSDLIVEAGSLDSIPKFILSEIKLLGSILFYKKYSFLMGTTLSVRLENKTKKGLYFCIPFRSLKLGYLEMYLNRCTIIKPNFDHNMKRASDQYSYEELKSMTEKYYAKASYIVERQHLPFYQ